MVLFDFGSSIISHAAFLLFSVHASRRYLGIAYYFIVYRRMVAYWKNLNLYINCYIEYTFVLFNLLGLNSSSVSYKILYLCLPIEQLQHVSSRRNVLINQFLNSLATKLSTPYREPGLAESTSSAATPRNSAMRVVIARRAR